jgi:hypothetical protein
MDGVGLVGKRLEDKIYQHYKSESESGLKVNILKKVRVLSA